MDFTTALIIVAALTAFHFCLFCRTEGMRGAFCMITGGLSALGLKGKTRVLVLVVYFSSSLLLSALLLWWFPVVCTWCMAIGEVWSLIGLWYAGRLLRQGRLS